MITGIPVIFDYLKKFVTDNNISENVLFLGFIDRKEQLKIMQHSEAVIQPSLFEGWSTVIEDARALNKYIIASDLRVHRNSYRLMQHFLIPVMKMSWQIKCQTYFQINRKFRKLIIPAISGNSETTLF